MAYIVEGKAYPLFYTEGLNPSQAEDVMIINGVSLSDTIKIGQTYYLLSEESETEVNINGAPPIMDDAEMDRDGYYVYVLLVNNLNSKDGRLTSAVQKANNKVSQRYGGN